ncbi:MAG: DUF4870 domain-containing protein [Planctomycetota bacterium]|jgi:uncharacterized Tic20 family protein
MEETNEKPISSGDSEGQVGMEIEKDARMWSMFCHFGGLAGLLPLMPLVGCLIVPLIIWQVKKDDHSFIDENGKEALNFQLTILLIGVLLGITCVGLFLLPFVVIYDVVFALIAGLRANDGKSYKYPIIIRFIS